MRWISGMLHEHILHEHILHEHIGNNKDTLVSLSDPGKKKKNLLVLENPLDLM
jgi:hypothetical protein